MSNSNDLLTHVFQKGIQDILVVIKVTSKNTFTYEFINDKALEYTNLKQTDVGKKIHDVQSLVCAERHMKKYQEVIRDKQTLVYQESYQSPQGQTSYLEINLTPLMPEEDVSHIVLLVRDITEKTESAIALNESKQALRARKQRYESLFQYNIDTILMLSLDGEITKANLALYQLTGYTPEEVVGIMPSKFIESDDVAITRAHFEQAKSGIATSLSIKGRDRFNNQLEFIVKFIPVKVKNEIIGVHAVIRDTTEEKDLVERLMKGQEYFQIITENSDDLIALISPEGKIDYLSPSSKEILGYAESSVIGWPYMDLVHEDDLRECQLLLDESDHKARCSKVLYRMKHQSGDWVWLEMAGTPVFDEDDNLIHIVAISRDVTLRLQYEEQLEYLATHDFLTNLENRRSFKMKLSQSIGRYQKNRSSLALFMIDIDNFKTVNDLHGHHEGDNVLVKFANRLEYVIGKQGSKFRFGGDEFSVIVEELSKEEIYKLAQYFQSELSEEWNTDESGLIVTSSIGIAFVEGIHEEDLTENRIIKAADDALYEAKNAGRNQYKLKLLS